MGPAPGRSHPEKEERTTSSSAASADRRGPFCATAWNLQKPCDRGGRGLRQRSCPERNTLGGRASADRLGFLMGPTGGMTVYWVSAYLFHVQHGLTVSSK